MFAAYLILLFVAYGFKPLSCHNITSEVRAFLEDNGCTYVSVVRNPYIRNTLAKEIVMKTSTTLYTRAINTGLIEYLEKGFNVFPITLREELVKDAIQDIGVTRVQHSLVVTSEAWSNLDLGVFLEFVEKGNHDLMFYLAMPSPGVEDHVSWYQILSMKSGVVVNSVSFVDGSKLIKHQNFNLKGLSLKAITGPGPPFGLSSLDECTTYETEVLKCPHLDGYFSDMMPLLQRELNFTYELFLEHDWGMGPVAGMLISFLPNLLICCKREKLTKHSRRKNR